MNSILTNCSFDDFADLMFGPVSKKSIIPEQLEFALPGVKKEKIKLERHLFNGLLTIKLTATDRNNIPINRSRIVVIDGIDLDAITASYEDGLLIIKLPKKKELENSLHEIRIT